MKESMQKAKMNFLREAGVSVKEVRNLKWVNGVLFYKDESVEFTVEELV